MGSLQILTALLSGIALLLVGCGSPESVPQEHGTTAPPESTSSGPPRRLPGRWNAAPSGSAAGGLTARQQAQIEKLRSVGYVGGSKAAPSFEGVVVHDEARSAGGYNFFTSGHGPEALLTDMDGRVLHRWRCEFGAAFPGQVPSGNKQNAEFWRRAHLYSDGGVLAIFDGLGLIRLDRDSNLLWAIQEPVHHDLEVQVDGDIYVLSREAHLVKRVDPENPILEDFLLILGSDGSIKERLSVLECFENSEHDWKAPSLNFREKEKKRKLTDDDGDIFHANSLFVLDRRLAARDPAFRAGNVLLSLRHLDMIAVVDMERKSVVWSLWGESTLQHDATITPGGGLLFFDNFYRAGTASAATELDPVTRERIWQYAGDVDGTFYSLTCGTAQRLENGNTVITESDTGRAFEVTPQKEVVWDFYNPYRAGDHRQYIATLFELVRVPEEFPIHWASDRPTVWETTMRRLQSWGTSVQGWISRERA